ncbi:MAG: hypothetical protein NWR67_03535 [Saprospiraceae bacterium]|jgi:hypothetical protein|nr:hypothetical protein [Saprospiraceae bacterium]MDP4820050.1 hypothetical protein [Saprospiraceae bacterium]MDP4998495.1 hypothetical protein [Saprospiraceae bacterium]
MGTHTGIWLDYKQAFVINLNHEHVEMEQIASNIEDFHVKGGSRSKEPWGPMDKNSDTKYLERRNHQIAAFVDVLKNKVKDSQELYIFGPAEAKISLEKAILEDKNFKPQLLSVETSGQLTENQMIAKVKEFFHFIH